MHRFSLNGLAGGSPGLDWNGDGDKLDSSPFTDGPADLITNQAAFDINNFGIAGCEATPGSTFEIFDEPSNFDFNFRDGTTGQFDGRKDKKQPEKIVIMFNAERQLGADMEILPPFEIDGTETRKAGSNIPLKFKIFESRALETSPKTEITVANIRAELVLADGSDGGVIDFFEDADHGGNTHYHLDWKSDKSFAGETLGVRFINVISIGPGDDGELGTADDDTTESLLKISKDLVDPTHKIGDTTVTVVVTFR